jgi:hypothetical protein
MDDVEYAQILQAKFPVECEELLELIVSADTDEKFRELVKTMTK